MMISQTANILLPQLASLRFYSRKNWAQIVSLDKIFSALSISIVGQTQAFDKPC